SRRVVSEHPPHVTDGTHQGGHFLKILDGFSVCEKKDTHYVVQIPTGHYVLVFRRPSGVRGNIEIVHEPLGQRNLAGAAADHQSLSRIVRERSPNLGDGTHRGGYFLEVLDG